MDDATLRNQIGSNIAAYRKQAGLTQAGLAEKLNNTARRTMTRSSILRRSSIIPTRPSPNGSGENPCRM